MAKWLKDLFEDYVKEELEEDIVSSSDTPVVIGGIYFGSLASLNSEKPNKPLYFIVIDKVDDNMYEVLKVSDHYEFATKTDVLIDIGVMTIMVEVGNNFYLSKGEIKKFTLISQVSEQDVQDILLFRDGEEPYRPLRVGVTPIYREDIRNQFNETEFRMIEDLHIRVLQNCEDPEEEESLEEE